MYLKAALNVLLMLGLASIQFSFISGLPAWFNGLNLILIALIFILSLYGIDLALSWAIGVGFFMDIFSFSPFGIYLVGFSLVTIAAYFLLNNFFTNRSLYSFLALTFLSTILHDLVLNFLDFLITSLTADNVYFFMKKDFWLGLASQIALNLIFVTLIFYFINLVSNRLKPAFLAKKKII